MLGNGPIRFPYVEEREEREESVKHGGPGSGSGSGEWDEDEDVVKPLSLLEGVRDGELLLFALPSFLPIYACAGEEEEFGLDEDRFVRSRDTKRRAIVVSGDGA